MDHGVFPSESTATAERSCQWNGLTDLQALANDLAQLHEDGSFDDFALISDSGRKVLVCVE